MHLYPLPTLAPRHQTLGLSIVTTAARTVISMQGELDMLTAPAFGAFLDLAAGPEMLVEVDCAGVSFLDASALREIARVLPGLRRQGGDLIITSPLSLTYKILEITGFTKELDVERPAVPPPFRAAAVVVKQCS